MAIYFMEGFDRSETSDGGSTDLNDYLQRRFPNGVFTNHQPQPSYGGSHGQRGTGSGIGNFAVANYIRYDFDTNPTEVYLGFSVRPNSILNLTHDDTWIEILSTNSTRHIIVRFHQGRNLFFYNNNQTRSTTFLGAIYNVVQPSVWNHYEFYFKVDTSTGAIWCKVNGVEKLNLTGLDTYYQGDSNINHITIGLLQAYNDSKDGTTMWDDMWLADSSLGVLKIEDVGPTADGGTTDFTPQGGLANYLEVDEVIMDTGTYNFDSGTSGNEDLFTAGNLTVISAGIVGVQIDVDAQTTDTTDRAMYPIVFENVTKGTGTSFTLTDDGVYEYFRHVFEANPDTTSAWTVSEVNNMEIGYEVV